MSSVNISPKNQLLISVKVQSGARGPIGLTPELTIADTITGQAGTSANVSISGTALTFTIPQGNPFIIAAEYESVDDLSSNTPVVIPSDYSPELFDFVIINTGSVEDVENAQLYIYDGEGPEGGFTFVSDLSGATGPTRELRFRPGTSILEWRAQNGIDWIEGKDLALTFEVTIDQNDNLIVTLENSDQVTETINLTATAEFGPGGEGEATITSVKFNNNNNTSTSFQELGVYGSWQDTTKLVITNPNEALPAVQLGLIAEFGADEGDSNTELKVTNGDSSFTKQELGVYADWENITQLVLTNPDGDLPAKELGLVANFGDGNTNSITTLIVENPNETTVSKELGLNAVWGGEGLTDTTLVITNPSGVNESQELSLQFNWDGTLLGVKTADDLDYDYVDLKGETGDPAVAGTPLFKIRDQNNEATEGLQIEVADEIQFVGGLGVNFIRNDKIYTVSITEIDGGGFNEN